MKVLAIGDIHTKLWIIEAIEKLVEDYDKIVFCGDYADDWKAKPIDSINTWKALKSLQERSEGKVQLVTGNHDYAYVHHKACSGHLMGTQILLEAPENRELRHWLADLCISLYLDGVTYSHAGFGYLQQDDLWAGDGPLWLRPSPNTWYKEIPQVFGHTPQETCIEVQPNGWCIDTFSTYPDGKLIGDQTVLEITDGKQFTKRKLT